MSDGPISIVIVEDEPEFRRRFAQIIESEPSMQLVGVAANRREAQVIIDAEDFDVLLIDLGLPDGNGIDLIRHVSQKKPDADIMVVTVFGDEQHVVSSIEAGATGYILKDSTPADVISCIRLLRAGGSPVSPVVARSVLRAIRNRIGPSSPAARTATPENNPLSARETEILQLLAKGMSFIEIGEILGISPHTVTAHIKKIYRKLAVHSRGEAVYEATQMGLLRT
ncbi:MAG: response regulator [Betaproteobacteria bacterium]|jgi:DNA-binding NarL/FixJ family response regulator|nr:response regulator transcription factor [Burkholderiales bacterium]MCA3222701.1 response regulator transcription factor [Burkholderiales bacterium]MCA3228970.1 response regulator transcription factor [Burkholderiales bacterium]